MKHELLLIAFLTQSTMPECECFASQAYVSTLGSLGSPYALTSDGMY